MLLFKKPGKSDLDKFFGAAEVYFVSVSKIFTLKKSDA
jgi:hypothetical protein